MTEVRIGFFRRQWIQDGVFGIAARVILGFIFIYASIDKIIHPEAFAKVVLNYQILPYYLVNFTALTLPWLEWILGVLFFIGLFREGAIVIASFLLTAFCGVMIFNIARGLDVHCGCFGTSTAGAKNAPMTWYVIRDGLFLIPAFYLLRRTFRERETARDKTALGTCS